jgi:cytoskeletal protein CcmA (bactofilin family)
MFGKDVDKLKSFLGTQSHLHGELVSKGVLRLDGAVTGKIQADQVILTETAFIKGEIVAKKIVVGGNVEGILRASDVIEIGTKGRVSGEIFANKLVVVEGGKINGQMEIKSDKSNVVDFESKIHKMGTVTGVPKFSQSFEKISSGDD